MVIRRCWYNICFTLRPFLSKRCSWHHLCLAHWRKEMKSAACTKANGKGVGSRIISPSSSLDSLCGPGAGRIPKCLTPLRKQLVWLPAAAAPWSHSSWLCTCIFTAKAAVCFHSSHSLHLLSYFSAKPFHHHTAGGASHSSHQLTRKKKTTTHFLQWAPQIGWLHNKTMRGWEEMDSVSGFFLFFLKFL